MTLAVTEHAAADGRLSFRTGIERTSGDYGGTQSLSDTYVPLTVLYEGRRLGFRATLPYLRVEFADPVDASTYTEAGLGDIVLGLTVFDVFRSADRSLVIDVTNKIKLGTADEHKGLGTGESDFSTQADIYKFLGPSAFVATVGYRFRGEPTTISLDDTWLMSVGGTYRFSGSTSGGLFLDYRESSLHGYESIRELTVSLSHRLERNWRIQSYLVRGLSDTSLDWGAGLSARVDF
jgi:hypothetical protein